jgi:hypothetical protein
MKERPICPECHQEIPAVDFRDPLLVLVELKRIKRRIESGEANDAERRYYEANKESAWLAAELAIDAERKARSHKTSARSKPTPLVSVKCIGCKHEWDVYAGQIAENDHPMCVLCGMPAIAMKAKA